MMDNTADRGEDYEEQHVHTVYEQIASHFSSTRYKVCTLLPCHTVHVSDPQLD